MFHSIPEYVTSKRDEKQWRISGTFCALCVGLALVILAGTASAQMDMEKHLYSETSFTGFTGLTLINVDGDTIPFYRIQLSPNFNFGKIGLGMNLVFLYNGDEGFRTEDGEKWDSFGDYLRAIRYVRYGQLRDPVYGKYGALDYVTLGNSLLMDGYSNYDRRGLRVQFNQQLGGVDLLLANLAEPEVYGTRFYVRPLSGMDMALLHRLEIGATYLIDTNPNPAIDGEENFIAYGLDAALPLIQRNQFFLGLYDQLGFIQQSEPDAETASGNAVGVRTELMGANLKLEYRMLGEDFQPVPFDYTYENRKRSGEVGVYRSDSVKGIFSEFWYQLLGKFLVQASYEDYDAEGALGNPRLYGSLVADDVMEKVSLRGLYTKRGIEDFGDIFDLDEKSAFTVFLGYEFLPPLEVIFVHEFTFRRKENEDEGYETIRNTSIQFGASMNF